MARRPLSRIRVDEMAHHSKDRQDVSGPREAGQGLVEYALILALVSIVVISSLAMLGRAIDEAFGLVVAALSPEDQSTPTCPASPLPLVGVVALGFWLRRPGTPAGPDRL